VNAVVPWGRMPADARPLPRSERVEAFSDAIFAITITLLVLEIDRPSFSRPDLAGRLVDNWSQYAAFSVSFVYIGVLWLNHHALFARIARVDLGLNWINLGILGSTSLLPFSTGVLAGAYGVDAPTENRAAAVALYAIVAMLMSTAWLPVFPYLARHPELLVDPQDATLLAAQWSRPLVGIVSYATGGVLGWLVNPSRALLSFLWMIVYHAITSEGLHANRFAQAFASATRGRAKGSRGVGSR
jgi:uncharacterized membrane protein